MKKDIYTFTHFKVLLSMFVLSLFGLAGINSQTCTAPNQCMETPGFLSAPASHTCQAGSATAIFTETFDDGFGVFTEDSPPGPGTSGPNDLTLSTNGDTPSFGTGPETTPGCDGGSNDGEFIFLEGSFTTSTETHCMTASIAIPATNPPALDAPFTMSFWYHMFGDNMGTLDVNVNGTNEFSVTGQQQTENCQPWLQGSVDMTPYAGTTVDVQICMSEGNGSVSTFESDLSIDHIQIFACAAVCELTCPDPIELDNDPGVCGAFANPMPMADPSCSNPIINDFNGTEDASGVYPVGTTTVTFTTTDDFGNEVSCSVDVTVNDVDGPTFEGCNEMNFALDPGECCIELDFDPEAIDNCGGVGMPETISTIFTNGNGAAGNLFDLTNNSIFPVEILSYEGNIETFGGPPDISVYYTTTANTWVGNETNPAEWTLVGTAEDVVSVGQNMPTPYDVGNTWIIQPGQTVGVFVVDNTSSIDYTNGSSTVTDGVLTLELGAGRGVNAANPFAGTVFQDRIWNGSLIYQELKDIEVVRTDDEPIMSGECVPIGNYTVSYEATDAFGLTSTCSFDINVSEYPFATTTLSCNDGVNISLSPDCEVDVTADFILEGGPYGCYDDFEVSISGVTGTIITTPGTYTVTVTDPSTGNSCWGNITVEDKLPPTLDCECEPGGDPVTEFAGTLDADSPTWTRPFGQPGNCNPSAAGVPYQAFNFYIDMDAGVNLEQVSFTAPSGDGFIAVYENTFDPNEPCLNLVGTNDDGGVGLLAQIDLMLTANVNYILVVTTFNNNGNDFGDFVVELTSDATAFSIAPECMFSCTQLESVMGGYVDVPMPTVTGGCSGFNLAFTDYVTAGEVCGQQILQRVWYVTDVTGTITDQCVSEYIFNAVSFGEISLPPALVELPCGTGTDPEDIEAFFDNPLTTDVAMSANCPLDIEENNEGIPFAYPHYFAIGCNNVENPQAVNNNVCNIYATYSDQFIPACGSGCDGNTKVIRTWTLLNWCDASTTEFVQIIKSIDQEAPTFVATDVFASVEVHSCVAHIEMPQPWELHDNCDENPDYSVQGPAGVAITGNSTDGYVALNVPKGVHTFTYLATDCCGNVGSQTVTVTVEDNTAPVPVATQNIVISLSSTTGDGQGTAKLFASSVDNGSHDSCSDVKIEIRRDSDNCGVNGNATYNADGHPQDGNPLIDTDGGQFVKFCCADLTEVDGNGVPFGIHKVWMRVFDDGDMNGIFGTAGDNYNEIWVNVRVEDKLAPAIVCPPDITIECDEDYTDLDLTGEAEAFGTCDGLAVEYTDTPFLDACNEGFVQRRWFIAGNPFGTFCIQRITIVREDPPFNGVITWPQDMTVNCTDANPGEPTWTAGPCDVIGYDVDSDTFLFEDGACFKILNEYTVIDWCQYEPNSPFWNGEGIWTHTQIIKVIDNVPPEITCEDAMYAVNDNNDADGDGNLCENRAVMLTNSAVDGGGDCMSEWLKWQVEVDVWGDGTTDYVFSSFVPPFSPFYIAPTGSNEEVKVTIPEDIESSMSNHKVFWQVTDGCGNNAGCQNTFMVVDKKAPTPYCVSLSSALMDESGEVELWAIDFNIGSFDNCSEQEDLRYTFSSTPPENDPLYDEDLRSSSQVFDCDDLPQVTVNMYVWDEKGNSDFCVVTLNLVDNNDVCPDNFGNRIAGQIETEQGEGVQEVEVSLMSNLPESPVDVMTDGAGAYAFPDNPAGIDYTVAPAKDGDYMNGVSTLDLVLIQRHILNLEQFNSPYKVIAADINYDAKVSAADLVDLRKLILGVNTELANNMSWRFVDADQEFAEVTNPWPFDEVIDIASLNGDMNDNDFVGVKIGDVNGSAESNLTANSSEVRSANTLTLTVAEQTIEAGQTVEVTLNSADFAEVYGYQFTMELNGLSYTGVTGGAAAMNASNVGVLKSNLVTVSYSNSAAVTAGAEEGIFTMTFTAEKAGQLSEMMKITSRATRAEAYVGSSLEIQDIELTIRTENGEEVSDNYVLNQNEPNPFKDQTTVSFYAPESASATITVYDVTGKVVMVRDMEAVKGHNEVNFTQSELGTSGILYYQLESGDFTATKKMIIIE